jgi:hypothetical protein
MQRRTEKKHPSTWNHLPDGESAFEQFAGKSPPRHPAPDWAADTVHGGFWMGAAV